MTTSQQINLIARFGSLLTNTGGNDPAELLYRLETEKNLASTNLVLFVLASSVSSQVGLLSKMEKEGLLPASPCSPTEDNTCAHHGGQMTSSAECQTIGVLADVRDERGAQFARYGTNETLLDGTGKASRWLAPVSDTSAVSAERLFRENYESFEDAYGSPTWMHLLREEIAEVFVESDTDRLREELIQVAALAVSWVEKIDARGAEK